MPSSLGEGSPELFRTERDSESEFSTIMLSLKYSGPDVEDGTMSADDFSIVIDGFLSAYIKIVKAENGKIPRIEKLALHKGSAEWVIQFVDYMIDNPLIAIIACREIVRVIKWAKARWPIVKTVTKERIVLQKADGDTITVTRKVYEKYSTRLIHSDLKKLNSPLKEGSVTDWRIRAKDESGNLVETQVNHHERPYFEDSPETETIRTTIIGRLNAVTKSTRNGAIYLPDKTRVPFTYVSKDPAPLYRAFGHDGPVKLTCVAHLDENLKPVRLEVFSVETIQKQFNFDG